MLAVNLREEEARAATAEQPKAARARRLTAARQQCGAAAGLAVAGAITAGAGLELVDVTDAARPAGGHRENAPENPEKRKELHPWFAVWVKDGAFRASSQRKVFVG